MNEQNISLLKRGLQSLGFEDGLEHLLRCTICYQPEHFSIRKKVTKEKDALLFQFHFERLKDTDEYACLHYDAVLRKEITIPDSVIGDENITELDQKMEAIDWQTGWSQDDISPSSKEPSDWKREEAIAEIVTALARIEHSEEGKRIADQLRMKYWADTPAQKWIDGLHILKNQLELQQRFYFFASQENITIEEAYRFLNNKWLEKRLYDRKKINGKEDEQGAIESKAKVTASKKHVNGKGKRK